MINIVGDGYRIWSHHKLPHDQVEHGNIDVFVAIGDSEYVFTIFTLANIEAIMERYKKSGECLSGSYFWAKGMVVTREISEHSLDMIVRDMIETGEYKTAMELIESEEEGGEAMER